MRCVHGERGMTLIELLVALAVLALFLPGVMAFFTAGSRSVAHSGQQTTATALAANALEEQRIILMTKPLPLSDIRGSHGPSEPRLGFSRQVTWWPRTITVSGRDVRVWNLTVRVEYRDERQVTRQVYLETFVFPR